MDLGTFLWTTFAVFLTMATFSFLYKDNPFYKFAEHLVVGVSAGYFVVILWYNGLIPNLFQRLADGDWYLLWLNSSKPWYLIPAILGIMMWARFSKKYAWVSRWPMALYIGISTGLAIPLTMSNQVNKQLYASMTKIDWANFFGHGSFNLFDTTSGFSQLIIFVGTIASLIYFFFSKAHKGAFGAVAKLGVWTLMVGFGASFGFTVMARISLFINRMQDIKDWGKVAFDYSGNNQNYSVWFQAVFWFFILFVIAYIIYEIGNYFRSRTKKA